MDWVDVESGKWKVEGGAVPDLTYVTTGYLRAAS